MKRLLFSAAVLAVLAIAGIAYVLRPSLAASAPIEAVSLDNETTADVQSETEIAAAGSEGAEVMGPVASTGTVIFSIVQAESEVRFSIDELLRNVPTTAVGLTNQVAGEIAINFDSPAESQVGVILVNARTLETDSENRNRMIRNEILDTADFEFITFTPTGISGLPETIKPGDAVSFEITGNLTIRSVTATATFDVTAMIGEDGRLRGQASALVLRSTYGLTIPSVPSVADVSDEVILEINFVADPK